MSETCKHGQLARACRVCELESEVARLKEALRRIVLTVPQATDHPNQHEACHKRMRKIAIKAT